MASADTQAGLKLIFLVTEDWYFWAHRLPQARAARDVGFAVAVATRVDAHGDLIRGEGFALHPLGWRRGSINPLGAIAAIIKIARLYRRERPAIVHHVSQKPILIGSIAAYFARVPSIVNAFTGLGFLFTAASVKAKVIRTIIAALLRQLGARPGMVFLVENPDDRIILLQRKIAPDNRIVVILGSGVDLTRYSPLPEPDNGPVVIGCATRMLRIKGVAEVVAAFRILRARGSTARLILAGAPDPENPASISERELAAWAAEPGIEWLGHVPDIRPVWARAHIAVLASQGGEGIPMSLIEAAACARPMVSTDVPGCREIVRPGETGLLAPAGDIEALAAALERMIADKDMRLRYGEAARAHVASSMDAVKVGRDTVAVYRALLNGACP
jgi:glycosyltransferase involved in cell wall biosynthesis